MYRIRKAQDRGHANHGWLDSYHTFSFADYYDPDHMGYSALRVINDDRIAGGAGFPTHPHRDMEIITVAVEGSLAHKDSMGTESVIRPGEVQYMSAGTGVRHSEFNNEKAKTTHIYQIWILPDRAGHTPRYGQKNFSEQLAKGDWVKTVSPDGADGSIEIHQDATMYVANFDENKAKTLALSPKRHYWFHVVSGDVEMGGQTLKAGDGVAISEENALEIKTRSRSHLILFDLP